jgi:predicted nucleotidyltransferase
MPFGQCPDGRVAKRTKTRRRMTLFPVIKSALEKKMERERILALLKSHKRRLKKFGVRSISLFGSLARNRARKRSDVDLLVDFERPIGLFEFARLKMYLEEMLGREVDLVTSEALREELRESILQEAIHAV